MGIGVQAFEFVSFGVAGVAEEEVIAILAHVALLEDLSFATEALVFLFVAYLGLQDGLELVLWLVSAHQAVLGGCRSLEVAFLTFIELDRYIGSGFCRLCS